MKRIAIATILSVAALACGGKSKTTNGTPASKSDTAADPTKAPAGGATYGGTGGGAPAPKND
jgi:hypothetical protein